MSHGLPEIDANAVDFSFYFQYHGKNKDDARGPWRITPM
jgi:hypothetical protein